MCRQNIRNLKVYKSESLRSIKCKNCNLCVIFVCCIFGNLRWFRNLEFVEIFRSVILCFGKFSWFWNFVLGTSVDLKILSCCKCWYCGFIFRICSFFPQFTWFCVIRKSILILFTDLEFLSWDLRYRPRFYNSYVLAHEAASQGVTWSSCSLKFRILAHDI